MEKKCVYHKEEQKVIIYNYCSFFTTKHQRCGDQNFDCKPVFKQCKKCGSSDVKYIATVTPCFDEIGDKFKCNDCGDVFYKWA